MILIVEKTKCELEIRSHIIKIKPIFLDKIITTLKSFKKAHTLDNHL